jgi:3-deoxy-D-manno-octulosonic-acid transferase
MRHLYTFLYALAVPFILLRLYYRGSKSPKYRLRWHERFGFPFFTTKNCIWIHVVSLGETIAATPLIKKVIEAYPEREILITSTTPTGSDRIKASFGSTVKHCYFPYDLPWIWRLFFFRVKPILFVAMETELWPNLLHFCKRKKIPTIIANGRLSTRSCEKYSRFKSISGQMMKDLSCMIAQTNYDRENFLKLGLNPKKCIVTGSLKFDLSPPSGASSASAELKQKFAGRPVWMSASTHQGEDVIMMRVHKKIKAQIPNALLISVPRHPERFQAVEDMALQSGFNVVTRTSGDMPTEETDVFLGDTMGEMLTFYGASDVAFVGGSFVPVGGHNMLEPAALGVPSITGPHVENFKIITKLLLDANAAVKVNSPDELEAAILKLLSNRQLGFQMGKNGQTLVEKNKGAVDRQLMVIKKLMP